MMQNFTSYTVFDFSFGLLVIRLLRFLSDFFLFQKPSDSSFCDSSLWCVLRLDAKSG